MVQPLNKVAAISNPHSGKNKRGGFNEFASCLKQYPEIHHFIVSQPTEIFDALHECANNDVQVILVNGGDGTLQLILTYLCIENNSSYEPSLLLLKAGTTSMSYGDVGCKGKLDMIIPDLVKHLQDQPSRIKLSPRSALHLYLPKTEKKVCGMFFGAGAIYSGILYCRQNLHTKGVRGELGPTIAMLRFLLDWIVGGDLAVPSKANVTIDKTSVQGIYNVITATTLQRLLMGVFPFWGEKKHDNDFAFSLIESQAPHPFRAFCNIMRGREPNVPLSKKAYQSYCPKVIKLSIQGGFTLDGELFGNEDDTCDVELSATKPVKFLVR